MDDDIPGKDLVEVILIDCPKCGMRKPRHKVDKHICVDCSRAESVRVAYNRQHQEDWLMLAAEAGVDAWLQQPNETQWEYTIWSTYRDTYPGKRPTLASVAEDLQTSVSAVKHVSQRWTFPARMQLWMRYCDELTMGQRRQEILDMNKKHVGMATTLNEKLEIALKKIDANSLEVKEIVALAKLSTELERKARMDTVVQEQHMRETAMDLTNPEVKKNQTKTDDLAEVVQILMKAGVLGDAVSLGIKQTTEIVAIDQSGARRSVVTDD